MAQEKNSKKYEEEQKKLKKLFEQPHYSVPSRRSSVLN